MADPLMERLELNMSIDHDYIAHVDLYSTMRKHRLRAEIFDLEFTLTFPATGTEAEPMDDNGSSTSEIAPKAPSGAGRVRLRSNIVAEASWRKVPGDLIIQYRPSWFDEGAREYSDWQKKEWTYYKDCPYCHRSRFEFSTLGCDDPKCLWLRVYSAKSVISGRARVPVAPRRTDET
jgi:hypothetical protein